jgi:hypothetical protein
MIMKPLATPNLLACKKSCADQSECLISPRTGTHSRSPVEDQRSRLQPTNGPGCCKGRGHPDASPSIGECWPHLRMPRYSALTLLCDRQHKKRNWTQRVQYRRPFSSSKRQKLIRTKLGELPYNRVIS